MMRQAEQGADGRVAAVRSPALPGHRQRHDGWTDARRTAFLAALSRTGCVRDACARAEMSSTAAYKLRRRHPAFARAWDRALQRARPTIEQAAYQRAVLGWDEPILHGGKVVASRRRYSDSLLGLLLTRGHKKPEPGSKEAIALAEDAARAAGGWFATRGNQDDTDLALMKKLDNLLRQRGPLSQDDPRAVRTREIWDRHLAEKAAGAAEDGDDCDDYGDDDDDDDEACSRETRSNTPRNA